MGKESVGNESVGIRGKWCLSSSSSSTLPALGCWCVWPRTHLFIFCLYSLKLVKKCVAVAFGAWLNGEQGGAGLIWTR